MKRKIIAVIVLLLLAGGALWWWRAHRPAPEEEPEYLTAPVERGDLLIEATAPGVLEPLTTVEVKSRSGGEIKRIYVEPGDFVRAGDMIAQLDPTELQSQVDQRAAQVRSANARLEQARLSVDTQTVSTKTSLAQAEASLQAARARVRQAEEQLKLTREQVDADVKQSEAALTAARARLRESEAQLKAQPQLTETSIAQSRASLRAAEEDLNRLLAGARPQEVTQAEAAVRQAEVNLENAHKFLKRQEALLAKGFVSQQAVDDAREAAQSAQASLSSAQAALDMVKEGPRQEEIRQAQARVDQAKAALRQAEARQVEVDLAAQQVEAARAAFEQAQASLTTAQAQRRQVDVRTEDLKSSQAALKEAEASLQRARSGDLDVAATRKEVQIAAAALSQAQASLDDVQYSFRNTTIFAPRDGVVLTKPVEEGTVIPAGTALYSQGTAIVTLADVSKMYVMAKVDESDIGEVKPGQAATVDLEVIPGRHLKGKVIQIYPQGEVEQDVVYYRVRVQLLEVPRELRPGMTANVVIEVARLRDVLKIPDPAIDRSEGRIRVEVLTEGEPVEREIKIGLTNWTETQVIEGLKEGEEVVLPSGLEEEGPRGPGDRSRTARRTMRMIQGRGGGGRPR